MVVLLGFTTRSAENKLYKVNTGQLYFKSDAPLELIEAKSNQLKGVIDPQKMTFAFSIQNNSFEGFNSALQRIHFNENYLESDKYPKSTFSGKIIEQVDFTKDGEYVVRTKGKLTIHGVEQERIIKSNVTVKNGELNLKANFTVPLADHNITIPRIVYQKIAEEIYVEVKGGLKLQ